MRLLCAPLQGYTDRCFRLAHSTIIGAIDDYTTPFVRLEHDRLRPRDLHDLQGLSPDQRRLTTPQALARTPHDIRLIATQLADLGFDRLDLNLGCPFPKVVQQGYGAALPNQPDTLQDLLPAAVDCVPPHALSLKLRLPDLPQHLDRLADLCRPLPLRHITLHPRTAAQQYGGSPDHDAFARFRQLLGPQTPLVYNGDVTSSDSIVPDCDALMLGRGLLANPLLPRLLLGETFSDDQFRQLLRDFHQRLVDLLQEQPQPLPRLKTLWDYFLPHERNRHRRHLLKATSLTDYLAAAAELLDHAQQPSHPATSGETPT
ncbi:MAG: tRNA-dihydrouridine synthase [Oligosphaeraceae bacterium]